MDNLIGICFIVTGMNFCLDFIYLITVKNFEILLPLDESVPNSNSRLKDWIGPALLGSPDPYVLIIPHFAKGVSLGCQFDSLVIAKLMIVVKIRNSIILLM